MVAAKPNVESGLLSGELAQLQRTYPNFPLELGAVISYILTGRKLHSLAGNKELHEKKAAVVRESSFITEKYRSEFFFKHSIKVPYFSDLDWEVVVKAFERNVEETPGIAYALLSLEFEDPKGRSINRSRTLTVAVDQYLVEQLINSLSDVKLALQKSKSITDVLDNQARLKEKNNAASASPDLLGQGELPSDQSSKS